jgi:nitrous oxidase accessory protein
MTAHVKVVRQGCDPANAAPPARPSPGRRGERIARVACLIGAAALLISPGLPYWTMKLAAPQYPRGLALAIYPHKVAGDVAEIDGLNHYIGMRKIDGAATRERSLGVPAILVLAACLAAAAFSRSRWAVLLLIPVVLFPPLFLADLYWWLRDSGLNLDPRAALSSSIKPFVPRVLGMGKIAQFRTEASLGLGYYLSLYAAASALWLGCRRLRAPARLRWKGTVTSGRLIAAGLGACLMGMHAPTLGAATIVVEPGRSPATIGAALAVASPGDTILVRGGVHPGPLVVRTPVRLVGNGHPVIDGKGRGTVVRLEAPGCQLRGFTVRASGDTLAREDMGVLAAAADITVEDNILEDVLFGIYARQAPRCQIRGNRLRGKDLPVARRGDLIRLWYSDGVVLEDNVAEGGRDVVLWYSRDLTIRGNRVRCGRYGLHFMYCNDALVAENDLQQNSVGAFLMYSRRLRLERNWIASNRGPSGYGIGLKDMDEAQVERNVLVGNKVGAFLEQVHGEFLGNYLGDNDKGLVIFPSATNNDFRGNSLVENGEQVVVEGAAGAVAGNHWRGNYWSDYRGYDRDGDGLGDLPHRPSLLFERLADRQPPLRLFSSSPAAQAIDFASRVFPVFEPKPKLIDPAPAMQPSPPPLSRAGAGDAWGSLLLGAALVGGSAGLVLVRSRRIRRGPVLASTAVAGGSGSDGLTPPSCPPAISVRALSKRFGRTTAVDRLSFEVRPGDTVALWGPNGAGKSTILRCILGLLPFQGEIRVLGELCGPRGKASRRQIGYVPQEVWLHADRTIRETVHFFARLRNASAARADALICEWGLADVSRRSVRQLSGGMKQKLALVVALLSDPPVLLLDEPTSNLDARTRREFVGLLERLKSSGKTMLFCTHRQSEIWRLADRVVVLQNGVKLMEGPPEQVREHLQEPAQLCLDVSASDVGEAVDAMREAGFAAFRTGSRLLVDAPAGRRMEVLHILDLRGVTVLDLDVEAERSSRDCPADREG